MCDLPNMQAGFLKELSWSRRRQNSKLTDLVLSAGELVVIA